MYLYPPTVTKICSKEKTIRNQLQIEKKEFGSNQIEVCVHEKVLWIIFASMSRSISLFVDKKWIELNQKQKHGVQPSSSILLIFKIKTAMLLYVLLNSFYFFTFRMNILRSFCSIFFLVTTFDKMVFVCLYVFMLINWMRKVNLLEIEKENHIWHCYISKFTSYMFMLFSWLTLSFVK